MRHLRVPKRQTQVIFEELLHSGHLAPSARIIHDGQFNLVPISLEAPLNLGPNFSDYDEVEAEQPEVESHKWIDYLKDILQPEIMDKFRDYWGNSQEIMGDLLVFRVEREVFQFKQEIAIAKLMHAKKARLALCDNGVGGEFRIRQLEPLALRIEDKILDIGQITTLSEEEQQKHLSTRTLVREHMRSIRIDPNKAYYSIRLGAERWRTVESAEKLREILGRPLSVSDPYCGVGPALVHLLKRRGLVGELLASDLNPDAVELLFDNLRRWGAPNIPQSVTPLSEVSPGWRVGVTDALELANNSELRGSTDLLLINLPHDTMEHLPRLLPLLRKGSPTLVRGWVIANEEDIPGLNNQLQEQLKPVMEGMPIPVIEQRRQYNTTEWLCRFEAWLHFPQ
jgi:tRNA G37 N-methylase Trm5